MIHLFIINPAAKKVGRRTDGIIKEIKNFFKQYPGIKYDIYTSSWCRDAVGYIRSYVAEAREQRDETIRVHSIGGTGTLFDVVNGVVGLPDTQVAAHPFGSVNAFNRYFGQKNLKYFESLKSQVFDRVLPVDVIKGANNYGLCFAMMGLEAQSGFKGDYFTEKGIPPGFGYYFASVPLIVNKANLKRISRVEIDGKRYDGEYISVFIANTPCYAKKMYPGIDAHPDDGKLEVYLMGNDTRYKVFSQAYAYLGGRYDKVKTIYHYSGKKMIISADEPICMNIDSETFFGTTLEIELLSGALPVVCPEEIDVGGLPVLYNRPECGARREAGLSWGE